MVLLRRAVPHDALHARTVVPGAVKNDDLPRCGKVLNVALEIPLSLFPICRLRQSYNARVPRIQILRDALDSRSLAAASRPSKRMQMRSPLAITHCCIFDQVSLQASQLFRYAFESSFGGLPCFMTLSVSDMLPTYPLLRHFFVTCGYWSPVSGFSRAGKAVSVVTASLFISERSARNLGFRRFGGKETDVAV